MANQFSNVTAAASVGQWRQFSGAMQQLQDSKGAITQVVAPKFDPEKFNLAGSLLDVMGDTEKTYDNIKKVADRNAQEWANGKSFQEVAAEMKENRVPFQYDPFAMASLATIQGRNAFNIGMLEFEERLKTAEFVDKSPEEIDQIFIENQRGVLKDLGEAHGELGNSGAFMNGFWSDANKTREYVWKTSETVKNDYHKQQGLIAAESQLNELLDGSVDDLYQGITLINQSGMIGRTPEDQAKFAKSVMESLATHPDGASKVDQLADRNIPGLDGVTYRSLFGDTTIDTIKVKAENLRTINQFEQFRALNDQVNTLVADNDIPGLRALQQSLADQAGGQITKGVELVEQGLDAIARNMARDAKKVTALTKEQIRQGTASTYVTARLTGMVDPDKSPAGSTLYGDDGESIGTIAHEDIQEMYRQHFMSGNLTPDHVDNMLADEDGRKMFKKLFGDIEGNVKGDVQSVVNGVLTAADVKEPEGFRQVMTYIERDPRKVSAMLGYDQADTIGLLGYLIQGTPYNQYIASRAQYEKKPVREKWDMELPINTADYSVDNNDYETMFVRRLALTYLATGKDPSTAIKEARDDLKTTHQKFTYQSPHEDKGFIWDSKRKPSEAYIPSSFYAQFSGFTPDEVNDKLSATIVDLEKKYNDKDLYFTYDPLSRGVRIYNPLNMEESVLFNKDSIVPFKVRQSVTKG